MIIEFTDPRLKCRRSATFLPEVAGEQGWDRQQTIDALIRKAGGWGGIRGVGHVWGVWGVFLGGGRNRAGRRNGRVAGLGQAADHRRAQKSGWVGGAGSQVSGVALIRGARGRLREHGGCWAGTGTRELMRSSEKRVGVGRGFTCFGRGGLKGEPGADWNMGVAGLGLE